MTRPCRIDDCPRNAAPRKTLCHTHRHRIRRYGDPNFTTWTTADEDEVELIVRHPRPVQGLTRLEQRLIAQGLTQRGANADQIAYVVGVDPRTIYRWRARSRAA